MCRAVYPGEKRRAYYSKEHKDRIKEKTFSSFLLFTVVMLYKVTMNTKLVNTELLLLGGKYSIRFLQPSDDIFVNQIIHSFVTCMFMFKDTLFNIYCWLTLTSQPITLQLMHEWHLPNTQCLQNACLCLLTLRNTRQHFSITPGSHLNSEITNKKHIIVKNMAPQKGHLFTVRELK